MSKIKTVTTTTKIATISGYSIRQSDDNSISITSTDRYLRGSIYLDKKSAAELVATLSELLAEGGA